MKASEFVANSIAALIASQRSCASGAAFVQLIPPTGSLSGRVKMLRDSFAALATIELGSAPHCSSTGMHGAAFVPKYVMFRIDVRTKVRLRGGREVSDASLASGSTAPLPRYESECT